MNIWDTVRAFVRHGCDWKTIADMLPALGEKFAEDGGPGSGYFNHPSKKGQRGGSVSKEDAESESEQKDDTKKSKKEAKKEKKKKEREEKRSVFKKHAEKKAEEQKKQEPPNTENEETPKEGTPVPEQPETQAPEEQNDLDKPPIQGRILSTYNSAVKVKHSAESWHHGSTMGENVFEPKFETPEKLDNHFNKHVLEKKEYNFKTKEEYVDAAMELANQPVGGDIIGGRNGIGYIVRYNTKTNDFFVGNPEAGVIASFFKAKYPYNGYNYAVSQIYFVD